MQVAVVGHIEWGRFVGVNAVPNSGEIIHTDESWEEVAGGGSVAAIQLARLAAGCMFFTTVGDDELGRRSIEQLRNKGVEVFASVIEGVATKDIFVYIDSNKERTITVTGDLEPNGGDVSLPWQKLAEVDAVYFASGNNQALTAARRAKILVSTARILPLLKTSNIELDALVCSAKDKGEFYQDGELAPKPRLVVTTRGAEGGTTDAGLIYDAEKISHDEFVDSYGCGDSFAAGLTFALGEDKNLQTALQFAAHCGAEAAKRHGSFGGG